MLDFFFVHEIMNHKSCFINLGRSKSLVFAGDARMQVQSELLFHRAKGLETNRLRCKAQGSTFCLAHVLSALLVKIEHYASAVNSTFVVHLCLCRALCF